MSNTIDLFDVDARQPLIELAITAIEEHAKSNGDLISWDRDQVAAVVDAVMSEVAPQFAALVELIRELLSSNIPLIQSGGRFTMLPSHAKQVSEAQAKLITKIVGPEHVVHDAEEIQRIIEAHR